MADTNDYPRFDLLLMGIRPNNVSINAEVTRAMTFASPSTFKEADQILWA